MDIVVLGNGITGVTVARELRKRSSTCKITLVSGESDHHFSRPALMYAYMGHMRYQDLKPYEDTFWVRNRIELRRGWVQTIDTAQKQLVFKDGAPLAYDKLVLATGSTPNKWGWPGQDLDRVHGMYSLQDLIALERSTPIIHTGAIIGGGLIGIELAEMLHTRARHAILVVRESSYWNNVLQPEESAMVNRLIRASGIELRLECELAEIHDDGKGAVGGITTKSGDRIDCEFVGLTAGVRPNLSALEGSAIETTRGIKVNERLETNIEDVWAAGDCAHVHPEEGAPYLQQVWYTGRFQGEVAAANVLGGSESYVRGIWFNSAKFLDVEYQVYGETPVRPADDVTHLYWEHPDGEKSVRICHRDGVFIGLQSMGIRYRHRVCEAWIHARTPLKEVLSRLGEANFDPEFYRRHEAEIQHGLKEVSV